MTQSKTALSHLWKAQLPGWWIMQHQAHVRLTGRLTDWLAAWLPSGFTISKPIPNLAVKKALSVWALHTICAGWHQGQTLEFKQIHTTPKSDWSQVNIHATKQEYKHLLRCCMLTQNHEECKLRIRENLVQCVCNGSTQESQDKEVSSSYLDTGQVFTGDPGVSWCLEHLFPRWCNVPLDWDSGCVGKMLMQ